jgi:predicted MFS family arabinose efflux permease
MMIIMMAFGISALCGRLLNASVLEKHYAPVEATSFCCMSVIMLYVSYVSWFLS